jgi:hypothetical protein
MGAVSDIDYNRCAGYVQQQEEFQAVKKIKNAFEPRAFDPLVWSILAPKLKPS